MNIFLSRQEQEAYIHFYLSFEKATLELKISGTKPILGLLFSSCKRLA